MSQQAISSVFQSGLVSLPDDVLIRILDQLTLQTQLDMTHVHLRFLRLMPHVWRSQCKSIDFASIDLPLRDKDLRFLLGSNQQTFEVLNLPFRYIFNVFTNYVFPNLHDLALGGHLVKFDNSCVLKAIKTFPNLRSFTPIGGFTGQHFVNFSQLENLTLTFCKSFEPSYLLRILETCKLKTLKLGIFNENKHKAMDLPFAGIQFLEMLKCNEWEMHWFFKELKNLAHLKQLILCNDPGDIFIKDVITAVSQKSVKCLEFNDQEADFLFILNNVNAPIQTVKVSKFWLNLYEDYQSCEAINELYLKKCFISDEESLDLLLSLNICDTLVIESFTFVEIFEYTFNADRIAKGRRTKLHIYLYGNHGEEELPNGVIRKDPMKWKFTCQHALLEVHMDQTPNISYSSEQCSILFD